MIKHLWLDFSETLVLLKKEAHDTLRYSSYAEIVGKPLTEELKSEYEQLFAKSNHSNAAVFRSLGAGSSYWSDKVHSMDPAELYVLADENIPSMLTSLQKLLPISLFSNIDLRETLPLLGIDPHLFSHILSASMVSEPKPALAGFYKMVELSGAQPEEILYIGDHVGKDILPAKQVGIQTGLMWDVSPEATYCFQSFGEVLELIKQQNVL